MSTLDWVVLIVTTLLITLVGAYKTRSARSMEGYLKGDSSLRWPTIGLSVMATQASAITFLSVPGQAYEDGLRFVQFYFGMPLAMIVVAAVFVPIYYRMKVYTAYEYLEGRFDVKVRLFAALMFLISRGLAAGITIYAPAILLSTLLGWPLEITSIAIGLTVIVYTVMGGSKAVSQTQRQQMTIILIGLIIAGVVAVLSLPQDISLGGALQVAGAAGRFNPVDASFAVTDRYNLWAGLAGGFFLSLSYFGTDQSQVGRYLGGRSIAESRLGLLFNGVMKIPMQAGILFLGILVYCVYVFSPPPALWNEAALQQARQAAPSLVETYEARWQDGIDAREQAARALISAKESGDIQAETQAREAIVTTQGELNTLRKNLKSDIKQVLPSAELEDRDFIFFRFALEYLPKGILGLLVAVILAAAMSSIAGELQALGTTTTIDFHRRLSKKSLSDNQTVKASMGYTIVWGLFAIGFATFASLLDNLIQAVNILGSLFYGTVLGIFLTAFFLKSVGARAVLVAAILAESSVLVLYFTSDIGFLWFNVIGCGLVCGLSLLFKGSDKRVQSEATR